ncbi:MAG: hypothetical protein NZL87_06580, partial [Thermomicrobium sp.]|nr:hypothetical protein [Thermomicrobium sp.]
RGTLLRVDSTDFLTEPALAAAARSGCIALGFAPLANAVPLERDGTIMEFASIAASGTGATGLGILRMDVDDLGRIFASGLGEQLSLSRLASLSSGLRLFFEGWLTEKARQWNRQGKPVYLVYSGGDDVFAVGHWNTVARFAQEIRADFRRFTSQNPALHLSAGIAVVPEHAPLYQTADEAKDALEAAKQRREDGRLVKDAVTVFGRTLSWPAYGAVAARAAELATAVEEHGLPRSLLQALAAIGRLYEDAYREAQHRRTLRPGQLVYGRWMWLAAYTLARAVERLGTATPAARSLTTLRDELTRPEVIGTLWLVSRWAQLLTRKEEPS